MPEDSFDAGGGPMDSWRPTSNIGHMQITTIKRTFLEGDRLKCCGSTVTDNPQYHVQQ
jgi:hypothetical protein